MKPAFKIENSVRSTREEYVRQAHQRKVALEKLVARVRRRPGNVPRPEDNNTPPKPEKKGKLRRKIDVETYPRISSSDDDDEREEDSPDFEGNKGSEDVASPKTMGSKKRKSRK